MDQLPPEGSAERFIAVLVRQYTLGAFSLMNSRGGALGPRPAVVAVELQPDRVVIKELSGTISTQWIGDGRTVRYCSGTAH